MLKVSSQSKSPFASWMTPTRTLLLVGGAAAAVAIPVILTTNDGNRRVTAVGDPVIKP